MSRVVQVATAAAMLTTVAVTAADLVQHAQSGGPFLRSAFAWWLMAGPGWLAAAQSFVEASLGAVFWDVAAGTILNVPAVFLLALLSLFLFLMATAVQEPDRRAKRR